MFQSQKKPRLTQNLNKHANKSSATFAVKTKATDAGTQQKYFHPTLRGSLLETIPGISWFSCSNVYYSHKPLVFFLFIRTGGHKWVGKREREREREREQESLGNRTFGCRRGCGVWTPIIAIRSDLFLSWKTFHLFLSLHGHSPSLFPSLFSDMHTHTHTHTFLHTHACTHTLTHTFLHTHTHAGKQTDVYSFPFSLFHILKSSFSFRSMRSLCSTYRSFPKELLQLIFLKNL